LQVGSMSTQVAADNIRIVIATAGNAYVEFSRTATASSLFTAQAPNNIGSNMEIALYFTVIIAQWAGNGTVNLGPGAQEYYMSNSGSTTTAGGSNAAASTVYGPAGSAIIAVDSVALSNATTFACTALYSLTATDLVILEYSIDGTRWFQPSQSELANANQGSSFYGMGISNVTSTVVTIQFGNGGFRGNNATYAGAGQAWSAITSYKWRVRVCKASSPVGFGLASATDTGLISTTTQPIAGVKTFSSNPVVSGGGVQFPATQVPSADANCLDDYEEGTWTPTLTYGATPPTTVTYSFQYGRYTKVGRLVSFTCSVALSAFTKGPAAGIPQVTSLPFTVVTANGNDQIPVTIALYAQTFSGTPIALLNNAQTYVNLYYMVSNSAYVSLDDFDSNSIIFVSGSYYSS